MPEHAHAGPVVATLRLDPPGDGRPSRSVRSGRRGQWWLVTPDGAAWLGAGPLDLADGRSVLAPGEEAEVVIQPLGPVAWSQVGPGAVLELHDPPHRPVGRATVTARGAGAAWA